MPSISSLGSRLHAACQRRRLLSCSPRRSARRPSARARSRPAGSCAFPQPALGSAFRPMLPLEIPPDATIESLVTELAPSLHAQLVPASAPTDPWAVGVRIDRRGAWTVHIRGREMRVEDGEPDRPAIWMHTTEESAERFLVDARGPRRLLPPASAIPATGLVSLSDPRILKR